jgi:ABC-type antimicrobial peptide transport system permease subunit
MREVGPGIAYEMRSFEQQVADSVVDERAIATMSGLFGVLALLLASLGIYGVTSYSVRQRQPEIGIRLALGATAGRIVRLLLARTARATAAGAVCGVALAYGIGRLAGALLYAVTPGSAGIHVLAVAVLAAAGVAAIAGPALRAIRVDPAQTLRME